MIKGKREYSVPEIEVIGLDVLGLLAASPRIEGSAGDVTGEEGGNNPGFEGFEGSHFTDFEYELDLPLD